MTETLELIGDQKLLVERSQAVNTLKLVGSDGQIRLAISITPDGPVLRFEGRNLLLEATGDLAVEARRVAIHGREEVVITSGGDASVCAAGSFSSEAKSQKITAHLGSVKVKANDDVQLLGEEVLLNCDHELPIPNWLPQTAAAEVTLPRADTDGDIHLINSLPPG